MLKAPTRAVATKQAVMQAGLAEPRLRSIQAAQRTLEKKSRPGLGF
jgi:hypothetical protein